MDFTNIRKQFPMINTKMEGNDLIYFDSSATTFKPYSVIEAVNEFYLKNTASVHRGDYSLSVLNDQKFSEVRLKVQKYINSKEEKEIVFVQGTTFALNQIVFGYYKYRLKKGDEIILSELEHAANLIPWFKLAEQNDLKITYVPLKENFDIDYEKLKITDKTKVISLAHINNTIGYTLNLDFFHKLKESNKFDLVIDAAQSIAHIKIDVQKYDIDFLVFSAHKMFGPSGIGVLYGKRAFLEKTEPLIYGGGMNTGINNDGTFTYKKIPEIFEGGTPNAEGVYGLGAAIDFINEIGLSNIHEYEIGLKKYALSLFQNKDIKVYNEDAQNGVIIFNIGNIFSQDLATYFGIRGIAVRNGLHCAKLTPAILKSNATLRISFNIYNTRNEIDYLCKVIEEIIIDPDIIMSWV